MNYKKEYGKGGLYSLLAKGGKGFGSLSVKAGIDDNHNVTAADRIAGAQMNDKKDGGRVYRFGGKMYDQGGPVPTGDQGGPVLGSASTGQRFRVIPEKSPSGQTEMAYYLDGRPVSVSDFQEQFYSQGFGPGDINKMIEDSMKARAQGIGVKSMISSGGPNEARDRAYRDALQERNVYRDRGAAGVDSLYNARDENYARNMLLRGGE